MSRGCRAQPIAQTVAESRIIAWRDSATSKKCRAPSIGVLQKTSQFVSKRLELKTVFLSECGDEFRQLPIGPFRPKTANISEPRA